jgi:hypothetical protein
MSCQVWITRPLPASDCRSTSRCELRFGEVTAAEEERGGGGGRAGDGVRQISAIGGGDV